MYIRSTASDRQRSPWFFTHLTHCARYAGYTQFFAHLCQSQFLILEGRRFGLGLAYIFTLLSSRFRDGLEEEEEQTSQSPKVGIREGLSKSSGIEMTRYPS
jgi:hypothetical protein